MTTTVHDLLAGLPEEHGRDYWDGVKRSYIPDGDLRIDPSLRLHRTTAEVDPVTAEIIRYSLLNINFEHTDLLQKLAVSQLVIHSRDFQSTVMTEDGEILLVGPCVQFFAKSGALNVQYVLEHRSANPGIDPGDMFFVNDCFIGSSHQMDASLVVPVFVGDELFCWVSNTLHYQDVGGTSFGSWCFDAEDAWHEPLHWPPMKIVQGGVLQADVEQLWARQSRFPEVVGMDLRAAVAAAEATRGKIETLIARYGAEAVKGVMRSTQDASERLFASRLASIPDGRWSHRFYCEGAPGSGVIQTMQVGITKVGDRLIVDNKGTDAQTGSSNMTFAGFSGSAFAGIVTQLMPDVAGAFGGAYRRIDFRPESGTILCAEHPAAVSTAVWSITMLINAVAIATCKMLSCGDEATRAFALGSTWSQPGGSVSMSGRDSTGRSWSGGGVGNMMFGSFGGSPTGDGIDFGGHWWMPGTSGPNVEDVEATSPIVCLYRRGWTSGLDGAGRHRGGLGVVSAVALKASAYVGFATGEAFPSGAGVWGSAPGSRSRATLVRGSDAFAQLAQSRVPQHTGDLRGAVSELPWKAGGLTVEPGDVVEGLFGTIAGYGDPLLREPAAVLADVRAQVLDAPTSRRVYGVVLTDERVDGAATGECRLAARRDRLGYDPGRPVAAPEGAARVGELLHVVDGRWWCNGADLGPVSENYKDSVPVRQLRVRDAGEEFATPFTEVADQMLLREYLCPVTGYLIDSEMLLTTQTPLHDVRIAL